jgi:c-di-GMP-binding flagellar brake protein YcgR
VSCNTISIEELAKITPVKPPTVNKNTKPKAHNIEGELLICVPCKVANQLKILIPVGTAITIVAEVK